MSPLLAEKSREKAFSIITSHVNIRVEDGFFGQRKVSGGFQHRKFLTFDGKQHPKNIWFCKC